MRKKVARKLQKVASCNGMGRATCNFRELPGAFTYENPCCRVAISASKKGQLLQPNSKLLQPVAGFVAGRFYENQTQRIL